MINKKITCLLLLINTISLMGMSPLRRYFTSNLPQFRSYSSYIYQPTRSIKPYNYGQWWSSRTEAPQYNQPKRSFSFFSPLALFRTAKPSNYADYIAKVEEQKRQSDLEAIENKEKETQAEATNILRRKGIVLNDQERHELNRLVKRYSEDYITSNQETEVHSSFQALKSFLVDRKQYK